MKWGHIIKTSCIILCDCHNFYNFMYDKELCSIDMQCSTLLYQLLVFSFRIFLLFTKITEN